MQKYLSGKDAEWAAIFSNNVRFIMRSKKSSCAKIAKQVGVSEYYIRQYVRGSARPSDEIVQRIADALDCDVSELIDTTYAPTNFGGD
jgi:transcriptional regulator with XRE-family HTH domain